VDRASVDRISVDRIMDRLGRDHGTRDLDRYFRDRARVHADERGVEVTVPNEFAAGFLDKRFGRSLRDAVVAEAAHAPIEPSVRFRVDREAFDAGVQASVPAIGAAETRTRSDTRPAPAGVMSSTGRADTVPWNRGSHASGSHRPDLRLETFIVGESNRLACAAATELAECADQRVAPLFLHGSCGVGKTHLLHGVAARFRERNPSAKVLCTTGEAFTNGFVTAIRAGGIDKFRRAHRGLRLLCIDDVHLIAGKSATQTELLHTFDTLNLEGARILLVSDGHPRQTTALGQALTSRFLAGAVIRVETPDADLALRLVQLCAARRGLALEPGAAEAIASAVATIVGRSVRDIEGLIAQIEAVWRAMPEHRSPSGGVGLLVVERALGLSGAGTRSTPRRAIQASEVVRVVCRALSVEPSEMSSKGRHPRVVFARAVAAYLCRETTNASYPEIARAIGRPTHSTVVVADKKLRARLNAPPGIDLGEAFGGMNIRGVCARIADELGRGAATRG
jgi:chromosomal replication initiator protein